MTYNKKFSVGKCSTFGGPFDSGVAPLEGLALVNYEQARSPLFSALFNQPVTNTRGLARQLNERAHYCAMRWEYHEETPLELAHAIVRVENKKGVVVWCRPVDYGPGERTGRVIDLSPGAADALGVSTDDIVSATLIG